jgi:hypothetical protein
MASPSSVRGSAYCLFLSLSFDLEDGGDIFLRNVGFKGLQSAISQTIYMLITTAMGTSYPARIIHFDLEIKSHMFLDEVF